LKYFEDYNLSLTQRLGKIAILGQPPSNISKSSDIISFFGGSMQVSFLKAAT
jgi:hypothetical protein